MDLHICQAQRTFALEVSFFRACATCTNGCHAIHFSTSPHLLPCVGVGVERLLVCYVTESNTVCFACEQFTMGLSYRLLTKPMRAEDGMRECISHLHCISALVGWGKSPCLKNASNCKNNQRSKASEKQWYMYRHIYIFCYVTKGPYSELYVSSCGCLDFVDCNTRYYWAPVHRYGSSRRNYFMF